MSHTVDIANQLMPDNNGLIKFQNLFEINARPNLATWIRLWNFYLISYIGGDGYTSNKDLLFQHSNEYNDEYDFRLKMASYNNPCKPVIMNTDKHIFEKKIEREGLDDVIKLIDFQNLQNKSFDIDSYFSLEDRYITILGEIFYIIDAPENTSQFSDQQIKDLNLKWQTYPIMPQQILGLELTNGIIDKILIQTKTKTGRKDTSGNDINIIYMYFDVNEIIFILDIESEVIRKPNKFNRVPLGRFLIDEDDSGFGEGILSDIAKIANVIYNIDSIKTFAGVSSAFPFVAVEINSDFYKIAQTLYGTKWKKIKEQDKDGKTTIKNVKVVDFRLKRFTTTGGKVELLNIDLSVIEKMQNDIEYKENKIKELASQRTQELIRQSGIAKRYDYADENSQLKYMSRIFKRFEMDFWELFFDLSGINKKIDDINLAYPEVFDVIDKDKVIEQLVMYKDTVSSELAKKEADKVLTDIYLKGYIPDKTIDEIKVQIDTEPIKETSPELSNTISQDFLNEQNAIESNLDKEINNLKQEAIQNG